MDNTIIISVCAILMSVLALLNNWRNTRLQRMHNKLSLKPILSISVVRDKELGLEFMLANNGVGPACITKTTHLVDNDIVEMQTHEDIAKFFTKLGLEKIVTQKNVSSYFDRIVYKFGSSSMKPGESTCILGLEPLAKELENVNINDWLDEVLGAFHRVAIAVDYESVYGEEFRELFVGPSIWKNKH